MEAALLHVHHAPAREAIRDAQGALVGVIERQRHTRKLIARNCWGVIVGVYDERSRLTRDARGTIIGTTNLLPALLWRGH